MSVSWGSTVFSGMPVTPSTTITVALLAAPATAGL